MYVKADTTCIENKRHKLVRLRPEYSPDGKRSVGGPRKHRKDYHT